MSQHIDFKNHENLTYFLSHIVRQEGAMSLCAERLNDSEFDPQGELLIKLVWCIARDFYKQFRTLPVYDQVMMELRSRMQAQPFFTPDWVQRGQELVVRVFSFQLQPFQSNGEWFRQMLESFLWQRTVSIKARTAVEQGNFSRSMWDTISKDVQRSQISNAAEVTPFADPTGAMLGVTPRSPTGVPFLDSFLNGGTRPGELYGFLAPSGGGKTTLSNQLALGLGKRDRITAVFTYEQAPDNEYFVPVYAAATGIPRDRWELLRAGSPPQTILDEREMDLFKKACELIKKNIYWFDMSGGASQAGAGGVMEIDAKIRELNERFKGQLDENGQPRRVHAVIIDWFWPLVIRSYDNQTVARGVKAMDLRPYAQRVINEIKAMCQRHGVLGWLPHQANPAEAKKKRDLSFEDAAELKSFAWFMHGCWCLNKMDDTQTASIQFSKSRNTRASKAVLQLLGDLATFKEVTRVFDTTQRKFVEPGQINAVMGADGKSLVRQTYAGKPNTENAAGSF